MTLILTLATKKVKDRKEFVSRFLHDVIHVLADKKYQRRVWANGEGPECDSLDETMNDFSYFLDAFEREPFSFDLSKKELREITELKNLINDVLKNGPFGSLDHEVIKDHRWMRVVDKAGELSRHLGRFEDPSMQ